MEIENTTDVLGRMRYRKQVDQRYDLLDGRALQPIEVSVQLKHDQKFHQPSATGVTGRAPLFILNRAISPRRSLTALSRLSPARR